jgi:hypothetical protein
MSWKPKEVILMALADLGRDTVKMASIKYILFVTTAALIKESQELTREERLVLTQMLLEAAQTEKNMHLSLSDEL